jgi:hypothetical protein
MHIVLVHGFNIHDGGRSTIDKMAKYLRSHGHTCDTDAADYGWHDLIRVRFFHRKAVRRIAAAIMQADVVITHSNGANYVTKALKKTKHPRIVIHMSPALNKKTKIPAAVSEQHVFHTRHDKPTAAARFMLAHPWGNMGKVGYQGHDNRNTNHDYTDRVSAHSNWFTNINSSYFAGVINKLLEGD